MTAANGKVQDDVAERAVQAETAEVPAKVWLNSGALKPRDLVRARIQLADVLNGRAPLELLDPDKDEFFPFLIWCQRSRSDPSFSWDDALDTDFDDCKMGGERPPPPMLPRSTSGSSGTPSIGSRSKPPPPKHEREPSSASGSASTATSTTS